MEQKEVWDSLGEDWHKYRQHPVNEAVDFLKNKKGLLLDMACGSGRNFIKISGKIIGADFSGRMLRLAKNNIKKEKLDVGLVQSDILAMPFKDNSFDAVLCSGALHNIKWNYRNKALSELKRVSKNKADVFISVWNKDQPRFQKAKRESFIPWKSKGKVYQRYYYIYSKDELESLMKKYFKNVRVFGSAEKAFKRYPKNIIAIAKVSKRLGKS